MSEIPLVDLKAQWRTVGGDVRAAIERVLESQHFIQGPEVKAFEAEFARWTGAREAAGVASGTAALHLALLACGVGPGDEVITTANTFVATAEAISHTGARPVFVDVEADTLAIDPDAVEAAVSPRTKAVVPVHIYGQMADMRRIRELADRHGIRIVEDAAQSHGAARDGRRCGAWGDLACYSFYPGKNLGAYGDAGAVTGDDAELVARVRKLRDHGRTTKYEHDEVGFGERLDALQAAILRAKLPHLERWTEARRAHARAYAALLADADVELPVEVENSRHVWHLYVVRSRRRDALLAHLQAAGVGAGIHYPIPVHRQPAYAKLGHGERSLPVAERAAGEILSLPMFPELTEAQRAAVADAVRRFGK